MGLYENIMNQPITSLALRPLIAVRAGATVHDAVDLMRLRRTGCVIVTDASSRPVGMFNERLMTRLLCKPGASTEDAIDKHMTPSVVTVRQEDLVIDMLRTMQEKNARWVCVTDSNGRAVAMGGLRGLIEYMVDHFPHQVFVEPLTGTSIGIEDREGA